MAITHTVFVNHITLQNGVLFFQEKMLHMNCQMPLNRTVSHNLNEIFFFMIGSYVVLFLFVDFLDESVFSLYFVILVYESFLGGDYRLQGKIQQ